jgi:hypothetical protein
LLEGKKFSLEVNELLLVNLDSGHGDGWKKGGEVEGKEGSIVTGLLWSMAY